MPRVPWLAARPHPTLDACCTPTAAAFSYTTVSRRGFGRRFRDFKGWGLDLERLGKYPLALKSAHAVEQQVVLSQQQRGGHHELQAEQRALELQREQGFKQRVQSSLQCAL